MNYPDEEQSSPWGTLAVVGFTLAAAGIWALFNKAASANFQDEVEAQNIFEKAVTLSKQGIYEQAILLFAETLKKNPSHAHSYNWIAWIYASANCELDHAINHSAASRRSIWFTSSYILTPQAAGNLPLSRLKFSNTAILLANSPEDKACFIDTLAEVHVRRGEYDQSIDKSLEFLNLFMQLKKAVNNINTFLRLAWCYKSKQDFPNAYHYLDQALKLDSKNPETQARVGDICATMGRFCHDRERYQEAEGHYTIALGCYYDAINLAETNGIPDDFLRFRTSFCLNEKGATLYFLEDYENSWASHQLAHGMYPYNPYPILNLALLSARKRNKEQMRYLLEQVMPLITNTPYFQAAHLVLVMLNEPDFEEYRDEVLGLLLNHGKITSTEYKRQLKRWMEVSIKPNTDLRGAIFMGSYAETVHGSQIGIQQV